MIREIVAVVLLLVTVYILATFAADWFVAYGHHEKTIVMNISAGEFIYCGYGNHSKETVVCDKIERNDNISFTEMDWIIEETLNWRVDAVNISQMAEK